MRVDIRALLLLGSVLLGCDAPPVDGPPPCLTCGDVTVEESLKNKVDLLIVLADSPSMQPKLDALSAQWSALAAQLATAATLRPAWYHIGVITADLGAGPAELTAQHCRPDGDGARLQAPASAAAPSCLAPLGGMRFLDVNQLDETSNLPAGQDIATTLSCLSAVGHDGCAFQQPLEAAYRALKTPPVENAGFLRPDALLVVLFVDDQDDCSAPPTTDLFDPAQTAYGPLLPFRCAHYSLECGGAPLPATPSGSPLMSCADADPASNKLFPVGKYIDFFTKPAAQGGIKVDPNDAILATISAPDNLVETLLADPSTAAGAYVPCAGPPDGSTCALVEQHSCVAPSQPTLEGDPAVRLRQVVSSAQLEQRMSICDTSQKTAIEELTQLFLSRVNAGCVGPLVDPAAPDCRVDDVTANNDGSTTSTPIPSCATSTPPCWRVESVDPTVCLPVCAGAGDPGQHFRLTVDRGGAPPPPNTTAVVHCDTAPALPPTACGPPL
jgi:hypothetical protein